MATRRSSFPGSLLNTPLQILATRLMYVVLLIAFLVIGYLLGSLFPIKGGALSQTATPTTPQAGGQPTPAVTAEQVKDAFDKSVIKFGKSNAKNVVVETADPSCPYCHAAAGKNPELAKQMGPQFTPVSEGGTYVAPVPEFKKLLDEGKISYSYIYYPGHGSGEMGMKAFYCAYDNDKFWEVHDLIMSNDGYNLINNTIRNDKTQSQALADFLKPAIDPGVMKACLDSGKYDAKLAEESALASGVYTSGTPTYYINGTQKAGAASFSEFESLLN